MSEKSDTDEIITIPDLNYEDNAWINTSNNINMDNNINKKLEENNIDKEIDNLINDLGDYIVLVPKTNKNKKAIKETLESIKNSKDNNYALCIKAVTPITENNVNNLILNIQPNHKCGEDNSKLNGYTIDNRIPIKQPNECNSTNECSIEENKVIKKLLEKYMEKLSSLIDSQVMNASQKLCCNESNRLDYLDDEMIQSYASRVKTTLHAVLNGITTMYEIQDGIKDSKIQNEEYELVLNDMMDAGLQMAHYVNDIVDYCTLIKGVWPLNPELFDVKDITDEVFKIFEDKLLDNSMDLKFDIDQSVPWTVYLDKKSLLHILVNIVSNSIKYRNNHKPSSIMVSIYTLSSILPDSYIINSNNMTNNDNTKNKTIRCNTDESLPKLSDDINVRSNISKVKSYKNNGLYNLNNKTHLYFKIQDNGINNIDIKDYKKYFRPFYQIPLIQTYDNRGSNNADSTTNEKDSGLGLGLTIAQLIVEKMGGTIYFNIPNPPYKTCIIFQVPVPTQNIDMDNVFTMRSSSSTPSPPQSP